MIRLDEAIEQILERPASAPQDRSLLVGISGIDGCGKGYIARHIEAGLGQRVTSSAVINVDGWLNLPDKRFSIKTPAQNQIINGNAGALSFSPWLFSPVLIGLNSVRKPFQRFSIARKPRISEESKTVKTVLRKRTYGFTALKPR